MSDEEVDESEWTCEVCGEVEVSDEPGKPPDESWQVTDAGKRIGDCRTHFTDPDGNYVPDGRPSDYEDERIERKKEMIDDEIARGGDTGGKHG